MNLEYLREFTELAKHLSFTETARLLNMTQPTLSKHIAQFERDLRLPLFDRVGNSLQLTNVGQTLLPFAYQVLDSQSDFDAKVSELRRMPPPHLTVSGLTDEGPSTEVLGFLISLIRAKYGANTLEVKSRFNRNAREMLDVAEVDLIFDPAPTEEDLNADYIGTFHIADLPLIAIVSCDHHLAHREGIRMQELENEVLLQYEGLYLSRSWSRIAELCERSGFAPKSRSCPCSSVAELLALCANLMASVLVVGSNFGKRIPEGIKPFCATVPIIGDDTAIPFYFLYRKDNDNPVLKDAMEQMERMSTPPLVFS
ncbi:LysR family transcriptional regulator [Adlercreutzia murintestinalis]|uniref:LysR family transcriptional regulator n=1 Tax=Adlercreutzia murintestinalis TaxID=2941325 RepID=UPI00203AFFF4|nr:LysR family transcriptional regulator [Adlercreutzia murintestinalis]